MALYNLTLIAMPVGVRESERESDRPDAAQLWSSYFDVHCPQVLDQLLIAAGNIFYMVMMMMMVVVRSLH